MDVRACGRARDRLAKSYERDSCAAQVRHHGLAFGAVGMHGDIYRVAMIKTQPVMHSRLPVGADWERATESVYKEALYLNRIRQ